MPEFNGGKQTSRCSTAGKWGVVFNVGLQPPSIIQTHGYDITGPNFSSAAMQSKQTYNT